MNQPVPVKPDQVFLSVARFVCADGTISPADFDILRTLAPLLGLPVEAANGLANQAIQEYRSKTLPPDLAESPKDLYRLLLITFAADDVIDAPEQSFLEKLRTLLKLPPDGAESSMSATITTENRGGNRDPAEDFSPGSVASAQASPVPGKADIAPIPAGNMASHSASPLSGVRIRPLLCPKCQSIIPLKRAHMVACAYCSTHVRIPVPYLEALASRSALQKRQEGVKNLLAKLGAAPSLFGRILALIPEKVLTALIGFLFVMGPAGLGPGNPFARLAQSYSVRQHGMNLIDAVTMPQSVLLAFLPFAVIITITFALIYRLRRTVFTLGSLRAALVATAPDKPGGPQTCRQCGAPLAVAANAVGVTCPYCAADNLVNIPSAWLASTHAQAKKVGMSFAEAQKEYLKETLRGWETVLALILGSLAMAFFHVKLAEKIHEGPWLKPVQIAVRDRDGLVPERSRLPQLSFGSWTELPKTSGDPEGFLIPLLKGDQLSVRWRSTAAGPARTFKKGSPRMAATLFLVRSFPKEFRPEKKLERALAPFAPLDFTAPLGAWYRLTLSPATDGPIQVQPTLKPRP